MLSFYPFMFCKTFRICLCHFKSIWLFRLLMLTELSGVHFGLRSHAWLEIEWAHSASLIWNRKYNFTPKLHNTKLKYHFITSILKLWNSVAQIKAFVVRKILYWSNTKLVCQKLLKWSFLHGKFLPDLLARARCSTLCYQNAPLSKTAAILSQLSFQSFPLNSSPCNCR